MLGLINTREVWAARAVGCDTVEGLGLRAPVEKVSGRGVAELFFAAFRITGKNSDETIRFSERKRSQQDRVDDAKDCGVGADSECEGQDYYRGEDGLPPQRSGSEAQISEEHAHAVAVLNWSRHVRTG